MKFTRDNYKWHTRNGDKKKQAKMWNEHENGICEGATFIRARPSLCEESEPTETNSYVQLWMAVVIDSGQFFSQ